MTSKYYKLLILLVSISLPTCGFDIEHPKLPKSISCQGDKCCFESSTEPAVGLCNYGYGSGIGVTVKGRIK